MPSPCPDLIPDDLWETYAGTVHVFRDEDRIGTLRVGALPDSATEDLLKREEEREGAFIAAGAGGTAALRERLRADGYRFYGGAGLGISPGQDATAGYFVPGLAEADAVALGRAQGQDTVLVVQAGQPARLVAAR